MVTKQIMGLKKVVGILKENDYPEFATSEEAAKWVEKLRNESDAKRKDYFNEK